MTKEELRDTTGENLEPGPITSKSTEQTKHVVQDEQSYTRRVTMHTLNAHDNRL